MNKNISTEQILQNIYGITATGAISNVVTGGSVKNYVQRYNSNIPTREQIIEQNIKIKYLDEMKEQTEPINIFGGAKSSRKKTNTKRRKEEKVKKDITIYASPEYVHDSSLQEFMNKFFLYYRMSRSPNSAIYIIPPDSEMKKMVEKRGTGKEGSIELQRATRQNKDIKWEKYCFITYGNNTKSDRYRIDPALTDTEAYPNKEFEEIRRTNLLGEVFYISYKDSDSVYISTKPGQKSGNVLKFVARFNNGGYIFKGEVPAQALEKIGPKDTKKFASNRYRKRLNDLEFGEIPIVGGSINSSFDVLTAYDEEYDFDHDVAAEHFVRCFAKKNTNAKYLSNSDMVFNAIYYAINNPKGVNMSDMNNELNDTQFKKLFDKFQTVSTSREQITNLANKLNSIYDNNVSERNNSKQFIKSVNKIYSNINDKTIQVADIMTGFVRTHDKINYDLIYKNIYDNVSMENENNADCQTCSLINNAISSNTLPSLMGRTAPPVFCTITGGSFESNMKRKAKNQDQEIDIVSEIFQANDEENKDEEVAGSEPPPIPYKPLQGDTDGGANKKSPVKTPTKTKETPTEKKDVEDEKNLKKKKKLEEDEQSAEETKPAVSIKPSQTGKTDESELEENVDEIKISDSDISSDDNDGELDEALTKFFED